MRRYNASSVPVQAEPSLPYGGRVRLAKKKKAEGWVSISFQVLCLLFALFLAYACYFHPATLQFVVTRFYAHLGYGHAQHLVAQKYLHGYGVDSNAENAMFWLRKAAEQGHAVASYDLAIAHLKGMNVAIDKRETHRLLRHAAASGVERAKETLHHVCSQQDCEPQ